MPSFCRLYPLTRNETHNRSAIQVVIFTIDLWWSRRYQVKSDFFVGYFIIIDGICLTTMVQMKMTPCGARGFAFQSDDFERRLVKSGEWPFVRWSFFWAITKFRILVKWMTFSKSIWDRVLRNERGFEKRVSIFYISVPDSAGLPCGGYDAWRFRCFKIRRPRNRRITKFIIETVNRL